MSVDGQLQLASLTTVGKRESIIHHLLFRKKILTYESKAGRTVRQQLSCRMESTTAIGSSLCTIGVCEKFLITVLFL